MRVRRSPADPPPPPQHLARAHARTVHLVLSAVTVSKKKMQEENKGNSAAFRPLMPERQNVMDESRDSCEDRKAAKADFIRV